MKTLAIGYGNPLRSDDGIGLFVVDQIAKLKIPDVTTRTCHQLGVELVDDLTACERVIFVDAGHVAGPFQFRQLEGNNNSNGGGSHYLTPELLYELTKRFSGAVPTFYLCTVRGNNFNFGEGFSETAVNDAKQAIHFVAEILNQEKFYA